MARTKKNLPAVNNEKATTDENTSVAGFDIFALETDPVAEVDGVWKPYYHNGKQVAEVLVARASNENYAKLLNNLYEKNREVIDAGIDTKDEDRIRRADDVSRMIDKKCFCRTILKGLRGFSLPNGDILTYTQGNAELLYDRIPDFVKQVKLISANVENYRLVNLKKDAEELKK